MRARWMLLLFFCGTTAGMAQIGELLPDIFSDEEAVSAEIRAEELGDLSENPLNLNTATAEDLRTLPFLSEWQIAGILNYRERYGRILNWAELWQFVPVLDARTAEYLKFFCRLDDDSEEGFPNGAGVSKKNRHRILARYGRALYSTKAYENEKYTGTPDNYLLKYTLNLQNRVFIGFAAQQDAGEAFGKQGFDSYSGYVCLKNTGFLKNLTVGNYRIQWGYGLNVYAAGGFFSGTLSEPIQSVGAGIKPYASGAETGFLQGIAASFKLPAGWNSEVFFSSRRIDGSLASADSGSEERNFWAYVESLPEDGYHRTESELAKKHAVRLQLAGVKLEKNFSRFRIGLIGSIHQFGGIYNPLPQKSTLPLQKTLSIPSSLGGNVSLYYQMLLADIHLYGEYAYSTPKGYALLQGLQWKPAETFSLSAVFRRYDRTYYSPYADAPNSRRVDFPEADDFSGKSLNRFEWWMQGLFSHNIRTVLSGSFAAQRTYPAPPYYNYAFRFRLEQGGKRFTPSLSVDYVYGKTRQGVSVRAELKWNTFRGISGGIRLESRNLNKGLLLMQDIGYTSPREKFSIRLRTAIFHTDGYANRIYVYEPDVLYAVSSPAFYGKGCRLALLAKCEPVSGLRFELKYAHTLYDGVQTTGSADNLANTFLRPEIKAQLCYTLSLKKSTKSKKSE